MPNAVILMTALVPTNGHKYLIDYAKNLIGATGKVHVIVGTMDREPIEGSLRYKAILDTFNNNERVTIHHLHRNVPQEPNEHPDFWSIWRDIVREFVDIKSDDYFVASELYGIDMAEALGCKFMPCNRYRETVPVKGTDVRQDLLSNFEYVLPAFQKHLHKVVTIFGAESCGKTTMTRTLAKELNGYFVPEWAREYLETVGTEVTAERMKAITDGQAALQKTARKDLFNKPFIFQDTDLFSTVGYYRLWGGGSEFEVNRCTYLAYYRRSDLYIVMNDNIPFEADPLRYGGDKRESGMQYWLDLLIEFDLPYYVVKNTDKTLQYQEVVSVLQHFWDKETSHIRAYIR